MKVTQFLLRYHPPAIVACTQSSRDDGEPRRIKLVIKADMLSQSSEVVAQRLVNAHNFLTQRNLPQLAWLLKRLQAKCWYPSQPMLSESLSFKPHGMSITNVAVSKDGTRVATGSYDRSCKISELTTGQEVCSLEGHQNVVYAVAFSPTRADEVATGSFDKTCRLWDVATATCLGTLRGHSAEIVCLAYNRTGELLASGAMDKTARIWDTATAEERFTLSGHSAEVVVVEFSFDGSLLFTASFDGTALVWDARTGRRKASCVGHRDAVACGGFDGIKSSLIATGSLDQTVKLWKAASGECLSTASYHTAEITSLAWTQSGQRLASASADGIVVVYNSKLDLLHQFSGHQGEVTMIRFAFADHALLSASADKTLRVWDADHGIREPQVLASEQEVFAFDVDYHSSAIATSDKGGHVRVWRPK